ncbi:MAG: AAA family ATPase [Bacteroidetes bacterium GWA2_30_7]|nr:MAG: AAA family ATPase [Bacteroidetes bacterium GWA2_30_7]
MFFRKQIFEGIEHESAFLWGARQTGKSTLLKTVYPDSLYFDLLLPNEYNRFLANPSLLIQIIEAAKPQKPVIIDEIQRIPQLLNEIHWLITNHQTQFILSGSSPRKILKSGNNLLGGRAIRYELYPLTFAEIPDFDLLTALNHGLLPKHYLSKNPKKLLSAYVGSYLRDEIATEAKIRNIPSFSKFLETAAFSNGEIVNYSNIATDCGVSAPTIKEYFQILEDTLIGRFLPVYQKKPKRRVILSPKFYFFDIGITNYLLKRSNIQYGSEIFGNAFEHLIYNEIHAHSNYSNINYPVSYWRTTSQFEVDFILGNHEIAVEVKSTNNASSRHFKGLKAFADEYNAKKLILVCNEEYPRIVDGIIVLPWKIFLEQLWSNELIQ